jgi:hypothetical protein
LPGGPRQSAASFGRKSVAKIVSDTEQVKNTPIHVCAKTAFVGWPLTGIRQINSFHYFLTYNHYFREYFKLVYRKCDYGNFNHWYNVSPIHLHSLLGVGNFT